MSRTLTEDELKALKAIREATGYLNALREVLTEIQSWKEAGITPTMDLLFLYIETMLRNAENASMQAVELACKAQKDREDRARVLPKQSDSLH